MLSRNGKQMPMGRYMYEKYNGPIPEEMYVCHTCDNPSCINPNHLYASTPSDNQQDCVMRGRWSDNRGEKHWNARFTKEQIIAIKNSNESRYKLADEYGVHSKTIWLIQNSYRWKHLL